MLPVLFDLYDQNLPLMIKIKWEQQRWDLLLFLSLRIFSRSECSHFDFHRKHMFALRDLCSDFLIMQCTDLRVFFKSKCEHWGQICWRLDFYFKISKEKETPPVWGGRIAIFWTEFESRGRAGGQTRSSWSSWTLGQSTESNMDIRRRNMDIRASQYGL